MSLLHEALDQLKYDTRLVEWNIKNGKTTESDFNSHLDQLPDDESNCGQVEVSVKETAADTESMNGSDQPM